MATAMSRYLNLLWEMSRCEFKLRDQGTLLGFFWTLLHPALLFGVLYILFTKWMGRFVKDYPVYLCIGIVHWFFFIKGTSQGLGSIQGKSGLLKSFSFPREIVVLSSVAAILISYLYEFLVLLVLVLWMGHYPTWQWLWGIPILMICETMWILGFVFLFSPLATRYRDIENIWQLLTFCGIFIHPIFFTLDVIEPRKRFIVKLSPITHIMGGFRSVLMKGQFMLSLQFSVVFIAGALFVIFGFLVFKSAESGTMNRLR